MKAPKDKRTKAYKDYQKSLKENPEPKEGKLGDTIEKITKATGIKKVVEFIAGEDCGCDERKEKANEWSKKPVFRYRLINCPTEPQYNFMQEFLSREDVKNRSVKVTADEQRETNRILNRVFGTKLKHTTCCFLERLKTLEKLYEYYQ